MINVMISISPSSNSLTYVVIFQFHLRIVCIYRNLFDIQEHRYIGGITLEFGINIFSNLNEAVMLSVVQYFFNLLFLFEKHAFKQSFRRLL
jgi:hypothetical protein